MFSVFDRLPFPEAGETLQKYQVDACVFYVMIVSRLEMSASVHLTLWNGASEL